MSDRAQVEKEKGNEAFKAGDFPKAIGHYTAAFIADPSNHTYPLNRAAAYLKLGKNEDAERDCDAVLRLDAKNIKGYFRRGQARLALQKLPDAASDFSLILKLDPPNQLAKQELKKVQDLLKAIPNKPVQRTPIDVSTLGQPSSALGTASPKRRRIPIEIVDSEPSTSVAPSSSKSPDSTLLTPVSSRALNATPNTPVVSTQAPPAAPAAPSPTQPPPPTFREAREAREASRYRGGIFKADGTHKLFTAPTQAAADSNTGAQTREPPQTLVSFMSIWRTLTTEEERWDVLRQIPAPRLPVLFKTSLDASILAAIIHTLRVALKSAPEDAARLAVVRAYMVNMPRVPRFATVSLMMSSEERADVLRIWEMLGRYKGDGVEGQMERRKEEGSKAAWGCV
ncbi:hypothetical protein C2E23DRAFT_861936 [Lenzites betulinus]|nr:hypothetical protein C2E23DRAFT_861936 [Lenzites betulinus]